MNNKAILIWVAISGLSDFGSAPAAHGRVWLRRGGLARAVKHV